MVAPVAMEEGKAREGNRDRAYFEGCWGRTAMLAYSVPKELSSWEWAPKVVVAAGEAL